MTLKHLSAVVLLAVAGTAQGGDFDPASHLAEKCSRCHDDSVYTRSNRRVQSLQALDNQVRRCDSMLETRLFEDDIKTLVEHLNTRYYQF